MVGAADDCVNEDPELTMGSEWIVRTPPEELSVGSPDTAAAEAAAEVSTDPTARKRARGARERKLFIGMRATCAAETELVDEE